MFIADQGWGCKSDSLLAPDLLPALPIPELALLQNDIYGLLRAMGNWFIAELRKAVYCFARAVSDALEPPQVAVDQLKFEPARSAAVKIALDAGWIQGLRDGCPHNPKELVLPGQSEELLGTFSWSINDDLADWLQSALSEC